VEIEANDDTEEVESSTNFVPRDERRGDDRRSDGRLNADFFSVGESSAVIDNVRVSQRLQKKSIDTAEEEKVENVEIEADDDMEEVESSIFVRFRVARGCYTRNE
jgi:hypothetical protein